VPSTLRLPFDGRWFVMQGGDTLNVNHHMATEPQWYAIDFAKLGGPTGRDLARSTPTRCADFFGWEADVLAPADGVVVAVEDQWPDTTLGNRDPLHPAGNHVIVQQDDTFYWLAHLQRGSVTVRVADQVRQAQPLGRCGNSGNSDFPHLHFHASSSPLLTEGRGHNTAFGPIDVELTGMVFTNVTWPLIRGLFVRNHRSA
jgi:hypothetical protein